MSHLEVSAPLDSRSAKAVNHKIRKAVSGAGDVTLDLRSCTACDSASLAMLAGWKRLLKERFQIIVAEAGAVRRAFEVTGLSRSLDVSVTLEGAVAKLAGAGTSA